MDFVQFAAKHPDAPDAVLCAALAIVGLNDPTARAAKLRVLGRNNNSGEGAASLTQRLEEMTAQLCEAREKRRRAIRLPGFGERQTLEKNRLLQTALENYARCASELLGLCADAAAFFGSYGSDSSLAQCGRARRAALLEAAARAAKAEIYENTSEMSDETAGASLRAAADAECGRVSELARSFYDGALAELERKGTGEEN